PPAPRSVPRVPQHPHRPWAFPPAEALALVQQRWGQAGSRLPARGSAIELLAAGRAMVTRVTRAATRNRAPDPAKATRTPRWLPTSPAASAPARNEASRVASEAARTRPRT